MTSGCLSTRRVGEIDRLAFENRPRESKSLIGTGFSKAFHQVVQPPLNDV